MERIVGYVDSADAAAVQGWIANLERPEEQELIIFRGESGAQAAFKPFIARLDVCSALAAAGRYGFAIPTRLLTPLGRVVTVTDRNGVPLTNGETVELPARPEPARPGGRCWIMVHIQKTAGTSVRAALTSQFAPSELALVYPDPYTGISVTELGALPEPQRAALRLVIGHAYFGLDQWLGMPADYVTVLREPRARLRSHYFHHIAGNSSFRIGDTPVPLARLVQHGLTDEFDNLMTRMISGHGWQLTPIGEIGEREVELALRNIRERFRFVLLAERAEEDFPALCAAMNLRPVVLPTTNLRSIKDDGRLDAAVDWDKAMHRNRFDVMLYERVQAEGLCGRALQPTSGGAINDAA